QRLKGKVAVVCGAGSSTGGLSIGRATSGVLAREGARGFAVDHDLGLVHGTRDANEAEGGGCGIPQCDGWNAAAGSAMAEACVARWGRIDVLSNNVGIFLMGGPLETTEEAFDRLMAVNVKGMFLTSKAVIPTMLAQGGGSIINNASSAAIRYQWPSM